MLAQGVLAVPHRRSKQNQYVASETASPTCTGGEEVQAPTPPGGFIKHLLASSHHAGVCSGVRLSDDEVLQQA